jgi:hypothetical protein
MGIRDLKPLIEQGIIKVFEDIFDYVTVQQVATAMGCGVKQVEAIRANHAKLVLEQLFGFSRAVDMDYRKVMDLFAE